MYESKLCLIEERTRRKLGLHNTKLLPKNLPLHNAITLCIDISKHERLNQQVHRYTPASRRSPSSSGAWPRKIPRCVSLSLCQMLLEAHESISHSKIPQPLYGATTNTSTTLRCKNNRTTTDKPTGFQSVQPTTPRCDRTPDPLGNQDSEPQFDNFNF